MRIASLAGRDKSQVSRVLRVLAGLGFVERDPDTLKYSLGWQLFALASRAGDQRLLAMAPPVLSELVARLGETTHLTVARAGDVVTLLSESPPHAIRAAGWTGRLVPAHCTASGRALLLDEERPALEARFGPGPLARPGPNAPATVAQLYDRIASERPRGWVVADEELEAGLIAVAAPVRGVRGRIVAAVNVSAPRFRFAGRVEEAGAATKLAADRLSAQLGAPLTEVAERRVS
jgi:DNA-binding IclR family transcriptional regulator